ncbi:ComEC family competence protein [Pararhizobium sp. BT-229]|uniref:ComEC/Rec2 family competence protein n=1 Tax=Pararhizobium sp. BT-229 TaxID=2986923 RepID=UPI0021F78937|nr:ComEC/Rec2 family competence protein [Pararhizobium sp. BT-229]MCV9965290.1 ComEC family competence protein [Pararhizobium sp. BT-229]
MNEGQEPRVALRTQPGGAFPDTFNVPRHDIEITEQPETNLAPRIDRDGLSRLRNRARRFHWRGEFQRAVAQEQAFGHGFLFLPVFLGLGSLTWFSLSETPGFLKLALLMCVFGMAALILRHSPGVWRAIALLAAVFVGGMVLAAWETARLDTVLLDTPVTTNVRGTVTARETTDRGYWRYTVAVAQTADPQLKRAPAKVTLLSRNREAPIEIGGGIEGRARLSPPSGAALAGLNDFAFDSYFKGIGAVGYFYGKPNAVAITKENANGGVAIWRARTEEAIARWREAVGTRIRSTIGGDAGAIAAALVTAEERAISRPTIEALREAGLAHVLAISGLNMVLAAGTFLIGARTLLSFVPGLAHRFAIKKLAAAGALVMVFLYILISGGAVSAVRSWIMISIMLVAVFFDRPSISLRNVALSALVILVITPSAVTGPGFQMSFAATLALVAGYSHWRDRPGRKDMAGGSRRPPLRAAGGFFGGLLLSSFIGGMSTMIYSAGHFHRLAAYGLVGNVLAMPVISILVMPFALLAMLLMPFGLDRYPLLIMGQGLDWMISIATMVSSWGGEVTTGRVPDGAFMFIAAGGILACLLRSWLAISGMLLIAAGLVTGAAASLARPDLIVAEDGRLVALVEQDAGASNRAKPPDFVFSQWQRALRLKDHHKPVERADLTVKDAEVPATVAAEPGGIRKNKPPIDKDEARSAIRTLLAEAQPGRFACVPKQWCAAKASQGWRIVTVDDARFTGIACEEADIVVTPVMLRFSTCRSGALLLSGRSLRRTGAVEIYGSPSIGKDGQADMRVVFAQEQLQRPWARHRTYDWRTGESDEIVPTE